MTTDCDLVADADNFADIADYIYTHILHILHIFGSDFSNWRHHDLKMKLGAVKCSTHLLM